MGIDLLDLGVEHPEDDERRHHRRAFRVSLPGLKVRVLGRVALHPVVDLSTFGLAFTDDSSSFQVGQLVQVDVHVQEKVWIASLEAKVVAVRGDVLVACTFANMTRFQEQRMDKLSLEIQKRWIQIRKLQKQQGEDEANSSQT